MPHDARIAPEKYYALYPPEKVTLSKNFMPEHPFDNGELRVHDELLAAHPRTREAMRQHLADYYAVCSQIDDEVGRELDIVQERGGAGTPSLYFPATTGWPWAGGTVRWANRICMSMSNRR